MNQLLSRLICFPKTLQITGKSDIHMIIASMLCRRIYNSMIHKLEADMEKLYWVLEKGPNDNLNILFLK